MQILGRQRVLWITNSVRLLGVPKNLSKATESAVSNNDDEQYTKHYTPSKSQSLKERDNSSQLESMQNSLHIRIYQ